jgi:hypothetical protein
LSLFAAVRDTRVLGIALRTCGLSEKSMRSIDEVVERVREHEERP